MSTERFSVGRIANLIDRRVSLSIAISLWCLAFLSAALVVIFWARVSTWRVCHVYLCFDVTGVYGAAAQHWLARAPLYEMDTIDNFQYLPQAAILYIPFKWLGVTLGGIVWRATGWGLYGLGIWRLTKTLSASETNRSFLLATVLALVPPIMSLFSGQGNLHVAASLMHATVELAERRWWRATFWLMLGLALKPIVAPMVLLVWVQYPPMRWRTVMATAFVIVLPVAIAPLSYVEAQYRGCLAKLAISAQPNRYFEDVRSLAWALGWRISNPVFFALRVCAGGGAAFLAFGIRKRRQEPMASVLLLVIVGVYLMLFNPRTQPNSYAILTPAIAVPAAILFMQRDRRAWGLLAILLCWCGSPKLTAHWLRPLTCIFILVLAIRQIFDVPAPSAAGRKAEGAH